VVVLPPFLSYHSAWTAGRHCSLSLSNAQYMCLFQSQGRPGFFFDPLGAVGSGEGAGEGNPSSYWLGKSTHLVILSGINSRVAAVATLQKSSALCVCLNRSGSVVVLLCWIGTWESQC
jgi:hypothetical protein